MSIHKTAIVSKKAKISEGVKIGPYVVIEDNVGIGKGTSIGAGSYVYSGTTIGENCRVFNNVSLGGEPQDLAYKEETSFLKIGNGNVFREYAIVHRGAIEGSSTVVGNDNYIMTLCHVGHNCCIHNNVILCSNVALGGHIEIEDKAFVGGGSAAHQFTRIGTLAIVGGGLRVTKDVPPFMLVRTDDVVGYYNAVGIKRANLKDAVKKEIKQAFKLLFRSGLNTTHAVEELEKISKTQEIKHLISFVKASKRGICAGKREPRDN